MPSATRNTCACPMLPSGTCLPRRPREKVALVFSYPTANQSASTPKLRPSTRLCRHGALGKGRSQVCSTVRLKMYIPSAMCPILLKRREAPTRLGGPLHSLEDPPFDNFGLFFWFNAGPSPQVHTVDCAEHQSVLSSCISLYTRLNAITLKTGCNNGLADAPKPRPADPPIRS